MSDRRFAVLPRPVVMLFLWIGLCAGICIRSLTFVAKVSPDASVWIWRFAMVCYTVFFGYRFLIGHRRRRVILEENLIHKMEVAEGFDDQTRKATLYVLNSIIRSKELFNYAFICILSVVALTLDLIFQ